VSSCVALILNPIQAALCATLRKLQFISRTCANEASFVACAGPRFGRPAEHADRTSPHRDAGVLLL